jgi:hypothetical protein
MTLANMRQNGVRALIATCEACGHKADVNADALPETIAVPKRGGGFVAASAAESRSTCGQHGTQDATAISR